MGIVKERADELACMTSARERHAALDKIVGSGIGGAFQRVASPA